MQKRNTIREYVDFRIVVWDDIVVNYTGSDITQVIFSKDGKEMKRVNLTYTGGKVTAVEIIYPQGVVENLTLIYSGDNIYQLIKEEVFD